MPPPPLQLAGPRPSAATSHELADKKRTPVIATALLASHPGPAMHLALLGVIVISALVVFAVARIRRKRDATPIDELDQPTDTAQSDHERRPR
jgi:hypothetical protein